MAIDYENFYTYAQLLVTPDVFIVPSELRYFVKVGLNWPFSRDIPFQVTWHSLYLGLLKGSLSSGASMRTGC